MFVFSWRGQPVQSAAVGNVQKEKFLMKKAVLVLSAAAVAVSATPALADHGNRHHGRSCAEWRHGHCARWNNHGYRASSARHAAWRSGYRFGPRYSYTAYDALPRTYVRRYDLNPDYRY